MPPIRLCIRCPRCFGRKKMKFPDRSFIGIGVLFLGILATCSVYWVGLQGSFFFDDYPNVVLNPGVKIDTLSWEALRVAWASGTSGQFGRPVSQISFALNHYFSGFAPFPFKLTNLAIHCLNGVLVYLVGVQILDSLRQRIPQCHVHLSAALVACAWLLHPIQLTSVLYVVQRMASLSTLFLLAALFFHVVARRRLAAGWQAGAWFLLAWGVFWPLSILSKETGILLSGFVAAYELIIRRSETGRLDRLGRIILVFSVVLILAVVPYLASPFGDWILTGYQIRSFSLGERLLTEARAIWAYLGWIVVPRLEFFALFHDDFVVSKSPLAPWTTLPSVLGLLLVMIWGVFARKRFPLVVFGVTWFLVGHALESTFIPLELVHEHRNYLSLFGLLLLPVAGLNNLAARAGMGRTVVVSLLFASLSYLGVITALRADMFANEQMRTQIEAQFHPDSARTNYEAGRTLAAVADRDRGNLMAAILARKHFERATTLDPDYKMALLGLLVLDCGISELLDERSLTELQRRFREALILQEDTSILSSLVEMSGAGLSCLKRSEMDMLFDAFTSNTLVGADKKMIMHSLHADYLWLTARDLVAAKDALRKSLEIAPRNKSILLKWAQLDYISGDVEGARKLLKELEAEPFSPVERNTLESLLAEIDTAKGKSR